MKVEKRREGRSDRVVNRDRNESLGNSLRRLPCEVRGTLVNVRAFFARKEVSVIVKANGCPDGIETQEQGERAGKQKRQNAAR